MVVTIVILAPILSEPPNILTPLSVLLILHLLPSLHVDKSNTVPGPEQSTLQSNSDIVSHKGSGDKYCCNQHIGANIIQAKFVSIKRNSLNLWNDKKFRVCEFFKPYLGLLLKVVISHPVAISKCTTISLFNCERTGNNSFNMVWSQAPSPPEPPLTLTLGTDSPCPSSSSSSSSTTLNTPETPTTPTILLTPTTPSTPPIHIAIRRAVNKVQERELHNEHHDVDDIEEEYPDTSYVFHQLRINDQIRSHEHQRVRCPDSLNLCEIYLTNKNFPGREMEGIVLPESPSSTISSPTSSTPSSPVSPRFFNPYMPLSPTPCSTFFPNNMDSDCEEYSHYSSYSSCSLPATPTESPQENSWSPTSRFPTHNQNFYENLNMKISENVLKKLSPNQSDHFSDVLLNKNDKRYRASCQLQAISENNLNADRPDKTTILFDYGNEELDNHQYIFNSKITNQAEFELTCSNVITKSNHSAFEDNFNNIDHNLECLKLNIKNKTHQVKDIIESPEDDISYKKNRSCEKNEIITNRFKKCEESEMESSAISMMSCDENTTDAVPFDFNETVDSASETVDSASETANLKAIRNDSKFSVEKIHVGLVMQSSFTEEILIQSNEPIQAKSQSKTYQLPKTHVLTTPVKGLITNCEIPIGLWESSACHPIILEELASATETVTKESYSEVIPEHSDRELSDMMTAQNSCCIFRRPEKISNEPADNYQRIIGSSSTRHRRENSNTVIDFNSCGYSAKRKSSDLSTNRVNENRKNSRIKSSFIRNEENMFLEEMLNNGVRKQEKSRQGSDCYNVFADEGNTFTDIFDFDDNISYEPEVALSLICNGTGPKLFAEICTLWPDLIAR